MADSLVPPALPVHPHQLEVQEFDSYDLIVDLRSADAFGQDHVPGAVSVSSAGRGRGPTSQEPAAPARGEPRVPDAEGLSAESRAAQIGDALERQVGRLPPRASLLVYCDRGGIDSAEVAARLRRRGFDVDVLPGGWASYRRWVEASLVTLSRVLRFRRVRGAPGGAAQAILAALGARGIQAVSLAELLAQHRLPGLSLPGDATPSVAAFESRLVDALRRMDPARPVWIDAPLMARDRSWWSWPSQTPDNALTLQLNVALADRVEALRARFQRQGVQVSALIDALQDAAPAGFGAVLARSKALAAQGKLGSALELVLAECSDRLAEAAAVEPAVQDTPLAPDSLSPESIWAALSALPEPWPDSLQPDPDLDPDRGVGQIRP